MGGGVFFVLAFAELPLWVSCFAGVCVGRKLLVYMYTKDRCLAPLGSILDHAGYSHQIFNLLVQIGTNLAIQFQPRRSFTLLVQGVDVRSC